MATTTTPPVGSSAVSTLSDWSGQYVTDMLGKAQAIADQPYQVYQGPMTAGTSSLQNKVFQGLGSLNFPSNLGQSFASPVGGMSQPTSMTGNAPAGSTMPGAFMDYQPAPTAQVQRAAPTEADWNMFQQTAMFTPDTDMAKVKADFMSGGGKGAYTGPELGATTAAGGMQPQVMPQQGGIAGLQPPQASMQPSTIAQTYMNPYLQSVLAPQLEELRRQNDITNLNTNSALTKAGAFGGGRQAIMNAENNRNLMQEMNKTVGQGYATAYDKAMGQFNTEQGQAKDLANLLSTQGATQRDIEQQGITADYNEFLNQRDYPMKQTQYLQSMLQGLPISTVSNQAASQSGIGQLSSTIGGLGNLVTALKNLGITTGP